MSIDVPLLISKLPELRKVACFLTRNLSTAEDLVQQTILLALEHQHRFEPNSNLGGWLFTIMRNQFINERRLLRNRTEHMHFTINDEITSDDQLQHYQSKSVSDPVISSIQLDQTMEKIKLLPINQQRAILLSATGHSIEEIALIEQTAEGTIKSRISRGRKTLHDILS